MNRESGIYCYENLVNGKKYIGQAQRLSKRLSRHESNFRLGTWESTSPRENKPLWLAVKKYGRESFSRYIIEYCDIDRLDDLEIMYIKELSSHYSSGGYNLSWGGGTSRGMKASEQARKNMSKAHIGEKHTLEHNRKIGDAHIGTKHRNCSSEYFGVYKRNPFGRGKQIYWIMDMGRRSNNRCIKYFKTEIEAAKAYNEYVISNKLTNPLNNI